MVNFKALSHFKVDIEYDNLCLNYQSLLFAHRLF
jgi:hypothetical protein